VKYQQSAKRKLTSFEEIFSEKGKKWSIIRLVPVVTGLYLTLIHTTSAFSLALADYGFSSRLQLSDYSPSTSTFSLPVSTTIPDLTISKFILWITNLRKQIE
jgi:hypothetical protein